MACLPERVSATYRNVLKKDIDETLCIYKQEHVYLESAIWTYPCLTGSFRLAHYPFTNDEHIDYVTAPMLALYLSQLGYVYGQICVEEELLPSSVQIDVDLFRKMRDEGRFVFGSLDRISFRRKIPISNSVMDLQMKIPRFLHLNKIVIGQMTFDAGLGAITGRAKFALILP